MHKEAVGLQSAIDAGGQTVSFSIIVLSMQENIESQGSEDCPDELFPHGLPSVYNKRGYERAFVDATELADPFAPRNISYSVLSAFTEIMVL